MSNRSLIRKMLHATPDFLRYHDHIRFDPATRDLYFMRLPDGSPVPIDQYEERLNAFREAQKERE